MKLRTPTNHAFADSEPLFGLRLRVERCEGLSSQLLTCHFHRKCTKTRQKLSEPLSTR
jgi:hypothetical protein